MSEQATVTPIKNQPMTYTRVMVEAMRDGGFVVSVPKDGVSWEPVAVVEERDLTSDEGVLEATIWRLLRGP